MRVAVGLLLFVGCYSPSPSPGAPCSNEGRCPVGLTCIGGLCLEGTGGDGGTDAPGDAIAIDMSMIDACGTATCNGNTLGGCGMTTTCTYGCIAPSGATPAHCARITPSNGLGWGLVPSPAGTLALGNGKYTFDTSTGVLSGQNLGTVQLPAGVSTNVVGPLRVLAMGGLTLSGAQLFVVGSRPLAILVDGDATLDATSLLSASAGCTAVAFDPTCGGPGGGRGGAATTDATGCGPGGRGIADFLMGWEAGGGGGGHATAGASSVSATMGHGPGGLECGDDDLEPLVGGSGGGVGGLDLAVMRGGRGGGGGGAIQLTVAGTLSIAGVVDAAGAGGENGYPTAIAVPYGGGGGGGAGGALLLEAGALVISGSVTANGGGGGGNSTTSAAGGHGGPGRPDQQCAAGGLADASQAPGGRGACALLPPTGGSSVTDGDRGGGGGALGRLRFNAITSQTGAATLSGALTTSTPPLE